MQQARRCVRRAVEHLGKRRLEGLDHRAHLPLREIGDCRAHAPLQNDAAAGRADIVEQHGLRVAEQGMFCSRSSLRFTVCTSLRKVVYSMPCFHAVCNRKCAGWKHLCLARRGAAWYAHGMGRNQFLSFLPVHLLIMHSQQVLSISEYRFKCICNRMRHRTVFAIVFFLIIFKGVQKENGIVHCYT